MGRPKEALRLTDGRSMIEAVAGTVASVCRRVVVVGAAAELPGVQSVDDLRPGQGPLGGIEALLASALDAHYLVCPCDVPLVSAELLAALTAPAGGAATVLRIAGEDEPRPLPARLSAEALPAVRMLLDREDRAVKQLIEALRPHVVEAPAAWAGRLLNVNTPDDYERALRALTA